MKKAYRIITVLSIALLFVLSFCKISVNAYDSFDENDNSELIDSIYEESGADRLMYELPDDAKDFLNRIKVSSFKPDSTDEMSVRTLFDGISYIFKENLYEPLRVITYVLGIILISALFDTLNSDSMAASLKTTLSVVTSLCMISVLMPSMLRLISALSQSIENSSSFMLLYIPVITTLTVSSGHAVSGGMFYSVMIYLSSAIMQIESQIIVPLIKSILSMTAVSSVSTKLSLGGITELFKKTVTRILTFCMSIFAAFLTMKSVIAVSEDSLSNKAVKFAINSFVPLVGGALSDALQTVISCVDVLKSGVGVAAMAAVFAIFLPAIVKCALWQTALCVSVSVCNIFGLSNTASFLKSVGDIIAVINAIIICAMVIYIISTAILIIAGG